MDQFSWVLVGALNMRCDPLIELMKHIGFPECTHVPSFLLVGRITEAKVVCKNQAGILFIAWRCLYAELVRGRIENVRPDMNAALKRTLAMNITRLSAYGERWLKWVNKNRNTGNKSYIPERHQDKKVLRQQGRGSYEINQLLLDEYKRAAGP